VPGDTNGTHDVSCATVPRATTRRVSVATGGGQADGPSVTPAFSADGRFIAFASSAGNLVPGDTNDRSDVFVHDLATGATRRVSVGAEGAQADDNSRIPTSRATAASSPSRRTLRTW
jgi:Tol biopolymer transport system component